MPELAQTIALALPLQRGGRCFLSFWPTTDLLHAKANHRLTHSLSLPALGAIAF
jgi:hypothetical protein